MIDAPDRLLVFEAAVADVRTLSMIGHGLHQRGQPRRVLLLRTRVVVHPTLTPRTRLRLAPPPSSPANGRGNTPASNGDRTTTSRGIGWEFSTHPALPAAHQWQLRALHP